VLRCQQAAQPVYQTVRPKLVRPHVQLALVLQCAPRTSSALHNMLSNQVRQLLLPPASVTACAWLCPVRVMPATTCRLRCCLLTGCAPAATCNACRHRCCCGQLVCVALGAVGTRLCWCHDRQLVWRQLRRSLNVVRLNSSTHTRTQLYCTGTYALLTRKRKR
jgi:hypothetical protein